MVVDLDPSEKVIGAAIPCQSPIVGDDPPHRLPSRDRRLVILVEVVRTGPCAVEPLVAHLRNWRAEDVSTLFDLPSVCSSVPGTTRGANSSRPVNSVGAARYSSVASSCAATPTAEPASRPMARMEMMVVLSLMVSSPVRMVMLQHHRLPPIRSGVPDYRGVPSCWDEKCDRHE